MEIKFNDKNGQKSPKIKSLIIGILDILDSVGVPFEKTGNRMKEQMALSCLALCGIQENLKSASNVAPLTTKQIIGKWNDFYEDNMNPGSYDSVRDGAIKKLMDSGLVIKEQAKSANSSTAGYYVHPKFVELLTKCGTDSYTDLFNEIKVLVTNSFSDSEKKSIDKLYIPLQQIFYGAPGTGKSHAVEQVCKQYKHHRTTFHPDSDYSTFVGCYKPTMEKIGKKPNMNLSVQDLAIALNGYYNDANLGNIGGLQKFVYEYYKYLNGDIMATNINQLLQLAGISTNYAVEVNKYIKFCKLLPKTEESKITYSFVPQTFIQAYTDAWQNLNESVFLVVEEINRGNCAQIFGDLFQLLDRKDDGYSSYEINADKDLQGYLCEFFAENGIDENAPEDIKLGKTLLLPPNLHIWATMNTSDQSLFPIDSAFKRRWDWKYVPIDEEKENWSIEVNGTLYSWSSFLKIINEKIYTKTNSEDKQLGFYFCKAKDGIISADKFVSKVLFYIYNDIFKDYGFDEDFFKDDEDNKTLSFRKYYDRSGNVNERQVEKFLKKLEVEVDGVKEEVEDEEEESTSNGGLDTTRYSFDGESKLSKKELGANIVIKYLDEHPDLTFNELKQKLSFGDSIDNRGKFKDVLALPNTLSGSYKRYYRIERTSVDGIKFRVLNGWNKYNIDFIIGFAKSQSWNVEIV